MLLYQFFLKCYVLGIRLASNFNPKAKAWLEGRKAQLTWWNEKLIPAERAWFHFASLGEFEQGRNIIEQLKVQRPNLKIIITFFSPSGYEIRKNYSLAERVYYLPIDSEKNAQKVLDHIQPQFIFFNKYEYWHFYIKEAKLRGIPLYINAAIFRKNQIYFKWYGGFYRNILQNVRYFFTQDLESANLLSSIGIQQHEVCGDTRFDRVYTHSKEVVVDPIIKRFSENTKVFVAGSTWPEDETVLTNIINVFHKFTFIIVPHEINKEHIENLRNSFFEKVELYSEAVKDPASKSRILIVDKIGLLSSIYSIAHFCYVGGAFSKGLHNTLEPATFGKPIFFGPKYAKFNEAKDLIKKGAAYSINNAEELSNLISEFDRHPEKYTNACASSRNYILENIGATEQIMAYLLKNNN